MSSPKATSSTSNDFTPRMRELPLSTPASTSVFSSAWSFACNATHAIQTYMGREVTVLASSQTTTDTETGSLPTPQRAITSHSLSADQRLGAQEIKRIHDVVEEIAYRAFADAIIDLGITSDKISSEQSSQILYRIKVAAHREMFKGKEGYISKRNDLLDPSQIKKVIQEVGRIIHDRDSKLTYARYGSISELLLGLDDHNTMVKTILISSWFQDETFSDPQHQHLERIKETSEFYKNLDRALSFDLKATLAKRKAFWDRYFPGMRDDGIDRSETFIQILEARHALGGDEFARYDGHASCLTLRIQDRDVLVDDLSKPLAYYLRESDISFLTQERTTHNAVKGARIKTKAFFTENEICSTPTYELLKRYFPELSEGCDLTRSNKIDTPLGIVEGEFSSAAAPTPEEAHAPIMAEEALARLTQIAP